MNQTDNPSKIKRSGSPRAETPASRPHTVGHGGVIDVDAYTAPSNLRIAHMEEFFGYLVRRLDRKIYASFVDALAADEITPTRFTALSVIAANPGVRQVDIARALEIARPASLKLVNQLIEFGLVETHPIPSDKRIGALSLSAKGHAKLCEFEQSVREHEARICGPLTSNERNTLTKLLRKLLDL